MKITKHLSVLAVVVLLSCGHAIAAIVLTRVGDDLAVNVENPVVFTATSNNSDFAYGFKLPGAINIAGSGGFIIAATALTAPHLVAPTFNALVPSIGLLRGGSDLEIQYSLNASAVVGIGNAVTLTPGVFTLPGFFTFSVIQGLNYSTAPIAILSNSGGGNISAPTTTIPEPSSALLFGLGAAGLALVRKRGRQALASRV